MCIDLRLHLQRSGVSGSREHGNVHKRLRHFNHKILTETCNENNGSVDRENTRTRSVIGCYQSSVLPMEVVILLAPV